MGADERLNVLVTVEEKDKFQRAADLMRGVDGRPVDFSTFVRAACHEMAERLLNENN